MKTRMVRQYICEFCDKRQLSSYHMKNHEKRCTLNPNRHCRMCKMVGNNSSEKTLQDLINLLPNPKDYEKITIMKLDFPPKDIQSTIYPGLEEKMKEILPILRKEAGNCPACILAALRQSKIPYQYAYFDFKEEVKKLWDEINQISIDQSYQVDY